MLNMVLKILELITCQQKVDLHIFVLIAECEPCHVTSVISPIDIDGYDQAMPLLVRIFVICQCRFRISFII